MICCLFNCDKLVNFVMFSRPFVTTFQSLQSSQNDESRQNRFMFRSCNVFCENKLTSKKKLVGLYCDFEKIINNNNSYEKKLMP